MRYLLEQDERVGTILEAPNATQAAELILANGPDAVFLDISMPGTSGMKLAETLRGLKNPPAIVFVTAYAEHAANAFNLSAVDYIVKPVEMDRLEQALDKIEAYVSKRSGRTSPQATLRISASRGSKRTFILASNVLYVEAHGDYSSLHTADGSYLANASISSLEERLASEGFLRVHRGFLVNGDRVRNVEVDEKNGMRLTLEGCSDVVPVSRRRTSLVRSTFGL